MHIVIAGTGISARNNTEALLQDFIAANPDITLVLPAFRDTLTATQIHAAQLFEDNKLPVICIIKDDVECLIEAEVVPPIKGDILETAMKYLKGQTEGLFIAWNDDDPLSVALLASAKRKRIKAADLTDGLVVITPPKDLKVEEEPVIPAEEDYEDDDESDEYDSTSFTALIDDETLRHIADIFAHAIAKQIRNYLR